MKQNLKDQKGASAVEFALVLPILVIIVFGIIEFSLALYDKAMITNASREGARAGIVYRTEPSSGDYSPLSDAEIANIVNQYLRNYLITFGGPANATTTVTRNGSGVGSELKVSVGYTYTFLVLPNLITNLTGGINLGADTAMRME
jgi:Flp pilus assembly protein TadG